MNATLEEVIKTLKDVGDAVKNASASNEEQIKRTVETVLKDVLGKHPGITPERKVTFEGAGDGFSGEDMVAALPKEVQHMADDLYILSQVTRKSVKSLKRYGSFRKLFLDKGGDFAKALDSTTAGGVDEWVPTGFSPDLIAKVRLQLKVAALFQTVTMPTNPYTLPVDVGDFSTFLQSENTADTGQTIIPVGDNANSGGATNISGNVTFTAVGHASRILTSKEATEDSIIPILPLIRQKLVLAMAQGREDILINGDNSGTHMDSDTAGGNANLRRKLAKGLRALSYLNSYTTDLSTMSGNNVLDMIALTGVYGVNPGNTAFVTGIKGVIQMMKADGFQTLDKIGAQATFLAGQLGVFLGRPVIVTEYMREDLNSSGIYASGSTKTSVIFVNRDALAVGERGTPTSQLLTELYAVYNQNALITSERIDIQPFYAIASNKLVYNGINVG